MRRIALSLLALLAAGGCNGSNATDPLSREMNAGVRLSADQSSNEAAATEITFTKWITTYPAMAGFTSNGPGTYAGKLLKRIPFDNGVIIQLQALYMITDPSGEGRSFTALIEGQENLQTQRAVLNGVITEGWRAGARVHVTFDVITPCEFGTRNTCFQGTIRVQPQQ